MNVGCNNINKVLPCGILFNVFSFSSVIVQVKINDIDVKQEYTDNIVLYLF